jgi:hypothetical protein
MASATLAMNGTSSAGEKFFFRVPKVWGPSGTITYSRESDNIQSNPINNATIAFTRNGSYLVFASGLFFTHGLIMPGLGMVLLSNTIGARDFINIVGQKGLVLCLLPTAFSTKALAGKTYTTINFVRPDQQKPERGISVGWTKFTATTAVSVTSSSKLLTWPVASNTLVSPTILISDSQVQKSDNTVRVPNMLNDTISTGFAGTMNASALSLGYNPVYDISNPGFLFAFPQEKTNNFNKYYAGTYKLLVVKTQTRFVPSDRTYPDRNDDSVSVNSNTTITSGEASITVTVSGTNDCALSNVTFINDGVTSVDPSVAGTYVPFFSIATGEAFVSNKLPGSFVRQVTAPNATTTLATVVFSGQATKQKRIFIGFTSRENILFDGGVKAFTISYAIGTVN